MAKGQLTAGLSNVHGRVAGVVFYGDPWGPEYVRIRDYNPKPHRALTPEQQHTCCGMQAAMFAYRAMIGGPYEATWQALAAVQVPPLRTVDYFCKVQLLHWKLEQGPSVDPAFPGTVIPSLPDAADADIPSGTHGVVSWELDCSSIPTASAFLIAAMLTGTSGGPMVSCMQFVPYPPGATLLRGAFRLHPGQYEIYCYAVTLDGSWPTGPIDMGLVVVT